MSDGKKQEESFIGKTIIVGLTFVSHDDVILRREELYGTISATREDGVHIVLAGGGEYSLPPDISAIEVAPPGNYRFKTTGQVIVNPDYMTTWTIRMPEDNNDS